MNGSGRALQGLQEARHQADPRARGVLRGRPHGPRGQDRAQPPDAARRHRRGLQEPHQALQRRLPRGPVPRQAGRRPPPASSATPRASSRSPAASPPAPRRPHRRGPPRRRRAPTSTSSSRSSAPRTSTSRSSATASPSRSRSTRRSRSSRRRWAARSSPPPTCTTSARRTTTTTPRCCACRRSRRSPQPKMSFDTNEFYLKSSEEMAESFSDMPEALASTLEIAERCDTTIALSQQLIPRFDTPNGESEEEYLRTLVDAGLRKRYGDPIPAARPRARRHGARRHRQHGLQRLLPDRLGLRRLREVQRHRGRPRPWLGRRQHRLLHAWRSRTSIRSATTCCSSASSTPSACRCRTSTSTSPSAAAIA